MSRLRFGRSASAAASAVVTLGLCAMHAACFSPTPEPQEPNVVHYVQGDEVPPQIRAEIELLDRRLLSSFRANDSTLLRELFVDEVTAELESGAGFEAAFSRLRPVVARTDIAPFHMLHADFTETGGEPVELTAAVDDPFLVLADPVSNQLVVSMHLAREENNERLVGMVYIRQEDAWRLFAFRIGGYRIAGRSAVGWFRKASELEEQGLLWPATKQMMVAVDLLRPLPFVRYAEDEPVRELHRRLSETMQAQHVFPIELNTLSSRPAVYRLSPLFMDGNLSHVVHYVTQLDLGQEQPLQSEAEQVGRELAAVIPGYCHTAERVAYAAYAEPPIDPNQNYRSAVVVVDCVDPGTPTAALSP